MKATNRRMNRYGIISAIALILLAGVFCLTSELDASSPDIQNDTLVLQTEPAAFIHDNSINDEASGSLQNFNTIIENEFYLPQDANKGASENNAQVEAELNLSTSRTPQCGIEAHAVAMRTGKPLNCSM